MVGKPVFAVAIMTIGLDLAIRVFAGNFYDVSPRSTGDPWGLSTFNLGRLIIGHRRIAAIVVAVAVLLALLAFFRYSRMGLAMRAAAFDQEVALIQGVSVSAVFAISWALASCCRPWPPVHQPRPGSLGPASYHRGLKALPVVVIAASTPSAARW